MQEHIIKPIAHIRSDFPTKFGIPRQAGIVSELESLLVFEPEYRNAERYTPVPNPDPEMARSICAPSGNC